MGEYVCDNETLAKAQQGDEEALALLTTSNMGLVKSIALRFASRGVEMEDLVQIGAMGMIKAVRGFQPEKGCRFTTYAVPHIAGEIKRFLRDDGWIKISREIKSDGAKVFRFMGEYEKEKGKSPTMEEICAALSLSEEKVVLALEASRPALSLYEEDENTGFSVEKMVGEDVMEAVADKIALREAVDLLPPYEKKIILLRYFKSLTQQQTAKMMGLSQVKVSREEKRILRKLREEFFSAS